MTVFGVGVGESKPSFGMRIWNDVSDVLANTIITKTVQQREKNTAADPPDFTK